MSFWCHCFDQNSNKNSVSKFCPEIFRSFLGSFLGFLEAYKKSQKAFRKPQGSYKKFQGRNPYNIFVGFLVEMMTLKRHFEIN